MGGVGDKEERKEEIKKWRYWLKFRHWMWSIVKAKRGKGFQMQRPEKERAAKTFVWSHASQRTARASIVSTRHEGWMPVANHSLPLLWNWYFVNKTRSEGIFFLSSSFLSLPFVLSIVKCPWLCLAHTPSSNECSQQDLLHLAGESTVAPSVWGTAGS